MMSVGQPVIELQLGDRVQLRKAHPCGSDIWMVYRVGADIGLRCAGCGHRVLLARAVVMKRLKRNISRESDVSKGGSAH
jgi:hypothetical protein